MALSTMPRNCHVFYRPENDFEGLVNEKWCHHTVYDFKWIHRWMFQLNITPATSETETRTVSNFQLLVCKIWVIFYYSHIHTTIFDTKMILRNFDTREKFHRILQSILKLWKKESLTRKGEGISTSHPTLQTAWR